MYMFSYLEIWQSSPSVGAQMKWQLTFILVSLNPPPKKNQTNNFFPEKEISKYEDMKTFSILFWPIKIFFKCFCFHYERKICLFLPLTTRWEHLLTGFIPHDMSQLSQTIFTAERHVVTFTAFWIKVD